MTLKPRSQPRALWALLPIALAAVTGLVISVPAAMSCGGESRAIPLEAEEPTGGEFKVAAAPATVTIGADGAAVITIEALGPFHWNKEYPATATVAEGNPRTVDVRKREFRQLAGDFEVGETSATVRIPLVGKAEGEESLRVDARFSVCTEHVCLIRTASVDVAMTVAP